MHTIHTCIQELHEKLVKARATRSVIISSPTSIKSFIIKFVEIVHMLEVFTYIHAYLYINVDLGMYVIISSPTSIKSFIIKFVEIVRIYIHTYIHTYIHVHKCRRACLCNNLITNKHKELHHQICGDRAYAGGIYIHTYMYINAELYCGCECLHVYMHACVYIHMHMHMHIQNFFQRASRALSSTLWRSCMC
jgi:hypothetical protein